MFDSEKIAEEVEVKVDEVKVEDAAAVETDEALPVEVEDEGKLNREKETVPLATLMETKRLLQEERRRREALERERTIEHAERVKADLARKFEDLGYTPELAKAEADERYQSKRKLDQIEQRLLNSEILELSKSSDVYADAMTYKDDIRAKMQELDVDAEQAYLLVRGSSRMKEITTAAEQRALAKRGESEGKRVESSSSTSVKNPFKLTGNEQAALRELQEVQPDAGWTAEKFYKMFHRDSGS